MQKHKVLNQSAICGIVLSLLLGSASLHAQNTAPVYAHPSAYQQQMSEPEQHIRAALDKLSELNRQIQQGAPKAALMGLLDQEITPYFDFEYMAHWVAGSMKRGMSPEQQFQFVQQLKTAFLETLGEKINAAIHSQYNYRIMPPRGNSRTGEVRVDVRISSPYQAPLTLAFRLYQKPGEGWKIFDILANNNSAVMYFRNYFSNVVRQQGINSVLPRH